MNSYAVSAVIGWLCAIIWAIQVENFEWFTILFLVFAIVTVVLNFIEVVRSCKK